jgi:hypothetical protein
MPMALYQRLAGSTRAFIADRRGAILAVTAVAMPVLVGFAGLGVEVGIWYVDKRDLQTAADASALSGAFERVRGNPTGLQAAAELEATRNGFTQGSPNTIAVNNPPTSGPRAGQANAVEAILTRPHALLFASLFLANDVQIGARAVAAVEVTGEACVLALDPTANAAVNNQGSSTVDMTGCVMASNSNSSSAIQVTGSTSVLAYSLWSVGQNDIAGSAAMSLTKPATTNAWALEDPYANLTIQPFSGCNYTDLQFASGAVATINPGVYCGGIDMSAKATVTLTPGTYILDKSTMKKSDLKIGGQTIVRCSCPNPEDGVTIILTSSGSTSLIGTVDIAGGADVQLRAPSSPTDPYQGVLFYQDRRAPLGAANANKLNGGSTMNLAGGLYFPKQGVEFSGNNGTTSCSQIVARTVTFTGNSYISNAGCQAAGVQPVTVKAARLVE